MKKPNEPLVFATLYGSKLYGTDGPNSDTDIRGVFIPAKDDLLLCKAPKHYNLKDETEDTSYLSIQYFLELLTQGETNALDMFFSYSNPAACLVKTPAYEELIANKDKLITKNVAKYLGYCKSQALKYSIKGERIDNLKNFLTELSFDPGSSILQDVLIRRGILHKDDVYVQRDSTEYLKNNKRIGVRNKAPYWQFGDHVYVLICDNLELYYMVSDHRFPLSANLNSTRDSIKKCLDSYGKRAYNAAADNGADYKALSHALRVTYQAEELLRTGQITFPLQGEKLKFVKEIKYKTTALKYEQIVELIEGRISAVEALLKTTQLRATPDWDWINAFVLGLYKESV